nr:hypothetical protein WMHIBSEC_WMHIBSEC_CDS_0050 [Caudoviricetes sp.]CAI9751785.1 hypothetical protein AZFZUZMX_AZFZUZMX_CDS_0050 [Caudoviricetes sp.]
METIANPFALVTRKGILTLDEGTKIQATQNSRRKQETSCGSSRVCVM